MIDIEQMKKELIRDEDIKYSVYKDSLGYDTIGVGFLVDSRKGGKLRPEEVDYILNNRIRLALEDIQNKPYYLACTQELQRRGLLNMRYQLGLQGLETFKNSLSLISQRKFKEAGQQLRSSKWYLQTPIRAERVIRMIENES